MFSNESHPEMMAEKELYTTLESYMILIICMIGMIINLINGLIFNKLTKTNRVFKYMLALSISEFNYFFLIVILHVFYISEVLSSYQFNLYKIIYAYLVVSFAINSIFIEIAVVIERYFILKNNNTFQKIHQYIIIITMGVLTFILYSPNLFIHKIVPVNQVGNQSDTDNIFELAASGFHNSIIGVIIVNISWYFRPFLCVFILGPMSITNTVIYYRRTIKHKKYSLGKYLKTS